MFDQLPSLPNFYTQHAFNIEEDWRVEGCRVLSSLFLKLVHATHALQSVRATMFASHLQRFRVQGSGRAVFLITSFSLGLLRFSWMRAMHSVYSRTHHDLSEGLAGDVLPSKDYLLKKTAASHCTA